MTIKDLAQESGYSVGTVSRVLNGHPNVSEKARQAVMAVVKAHGFELNLNAKNLKQSQSNRILVVVKGRGNELFANIVEQLQAIFSQTIYPLIIDYIGELDNEVLRAAALCQEKKPLGILFLGGSRRNFLKAFSRIPVPSVLVTGSAQELGFDNLSSVSADDRKGAACAVEYLLDAGHRDILVLGGDRARSDASQDRYMGCLDAFRQSGLTFSETNYYTCLYSYASGYETMKQALEDRIPCTAVFAMADVIAIGAIRAIREQGLRTPEDISVIGYDGLPIDDYLLPQLSSVAQPTAELAKDSAAILLSAIEHGLPARHVTVSNTLLCKESVITREKSSGHALQFDRK